MVHLSLRVIVFHFITLCAKLRGAVYCYCYRSCLWARGRAACVCVFVGLLPR